MNYAAIKKFDIANGPGVRVSLFVSGCRHHCKNCFNKEAWDFNYGQPFCTAVEDEIITALKLPHIDGITLLGGEPFESENRPDLTSFVKRIRQECPDKTVWCFTGFDFEKDLISDTLKESDTVMPLLEQIDVLVDGKFIEELKNPALIFRGSSNQRILNVKESLKQKKAVWLQGVWERKMGAANILDGVL